MEDDYFSIDAILAENQKIACKFTVDIAEMGHLGGGAERDIHKSAIIQIPLWLVYAVVLSDWADMIIPPAFNVKVRNALRAEPRSVRLSSLVGSGGLWYGLGKAMMELLDKKDELSDLLTNTFNVRLVEIVDQAQHFGALAQAGGTGPAGDAAQLFREGLDGTERELFALAQEGAKRMKRWYEENDKIRW